MPSINISNLVKEQLEKYKEKTGSKTYSDAINYLLAQLKILEQNQEIKKLKNMFDKKK